MELMTIINIITAVVTASSIILKVVAPLTKNTIDNKVLVFLNKTLKFMSLNTKE